MDAQLKQRVVGAAVLVALGVIFIPLMLDNGGDSGPAVDLDIGAPAPTDFSSRVIPIDDAEMQRVEEAMDADPAEFAVEVSAQDVPAADGSAEPIVAPASESVDAAGAESETESAADAPDAEAAASSASSAPTVSETPAAAAPPRTGVTAWVVQLGSFTTQANAEGLVERLKKSGYAAFIEPLDDNGKPTYRVRVGPELMKTTAERIRDDIAKNVELKGIVMRYP